MNRPPRIFFHCFSSNDRRGGPRETYAQVDVLNQLGFDAFVFHEREAFRLTWFENDTAVVGPAELGRLHDPAVDYFVLPETMGSSLLKYPGKKIIFNKSLWYGFEVFGDVAPDDDPYAHPDVVAVLAVSDHNVRHLRYAYPRARVFRVYPELDLDRFTFVPLRGRKRQLAWVPKTRASVLAAYHMLSARAAAGLNDLGSCAWTPIEGLGEDGVIRTLQESMLLVFFSAEEGFGRIVIEAMACGCLVVGFRNGSLQETLPDDGLFDWGDLSGACRYIEAVMADPERYQAVAARARERACAAAGVAHRAQIRATWETILHGKSGLVGVT